MSVAWLRADAGTLRSVAADSEGASV